eukprot:scaffold47_cov234-Alexandrium_tamarense.AAC.1
MKQKHCRVYGRRPEHYNSQGNPEASAINRFARFNAAASAVSGPRSTQTLQPLNNNNHKHE